MEHLLKLSSLTPDEIIHILDVADEYKRLHKAGTDPKDLQGKAIALMFGKHSTRTRTSLEVGIYQMGGLGTYLSAADMQIARGEPIQDTARVLGRYYDAIVYRTFKQSDVDALARYSGVPVVSGMTDYAHPLQVLTDLMTVREYKGKLAGLKAGFVGDGYNMANSLIVGCLMMGMDFTIACPNGYRPSADVLFVAREYGDHFKLTTAPDEAARGADVLFTDVWTSMGMERETERRRRDFSGFCLDAARMALAKPDCIVQHPLPAHRGEEITPDVFETHADEIFSVSPSGHPLKDINLKDANGKYVNGEITFAAMVPMQVYNTLQVPEERERLTHIRHLIIGGGAIDASLEKELRSLPGNIAIWSTYGMTETLSHIALRRINGDEASEWYQPFDSVKISQTDEGCLVIDAPLVCAETLVTNDIVEIEPYIYNKVEKHDKEEKHDKVEKLRFRIKGRKDNVICSGGIKIQIEEVEALLKPHLEMPFMIAKKKDEKFGEIAVLLTEDEDLKKVEATIRRLLSDHKYWIPREFRYVEHLPLTETGKPKRSILL